MLADSPGLVKQITFRPSRATQVRRGRERLSPDERMWLARIVHEPALAHSEPFARMAPERQALVLDVASDFLLYQVATNSRDTVVYRERNKAVLIARSKLTVPPLAARLKPFTGPPEEGHRIMRAGLGFGLREGEVFGELNFRLAFHDLLDPEYGYTPDAQVEALGISLRQYPERRHTRIERFTLLNIVSLSPINSLFQSPSWKLATGFNTLQHKGCRFCRVGNFDGGIGVAAESAWLKREVYFGFAELAAEYGRVFNGDYRVGAGASAGILVDITERWKIGASGTYLNFPAGDKSAEWRATAQQRYTLNKNFALRFDFSQRAHTQEYLFSLHGYF